jgi:hypothetical protein
MGMMIFGKQRDRDYKQREPERATLSAGETDRAGGTPTLHNKYLFIVRMVEFLGN